MVKDVGLNEGCTADDVRAAARATILSGQEDFRTTADLTTEQFASLLIALAEQNREELTELTLDQSPPPPVVEIMLLEYVLREFDADPESYDSIQRKLVEQAMLMGPHR